VLEDSEEKQGSIEDNTYRDAGGFSGERDPKSARDNNRNKYFKKDAGVKKQKKGR